MMVRMMFVCAYAALYVACIFGVEFIASYAYYLAHTWGFDVLISYEYAGAVAALVGCVILGIPHILHICHGDAAFAYKIYAPELYVACGLSLFELISFIASGEALGAYAAFSTARVVVLCVGIGFFEELLFRGIIFHALLRATKHRTHTFAISALLCSFVFGLAHIDFLGTNFADPIMLAQAVGKILQAGLNSYMFCAIVYCTRSVCMTSMLHAINDCILMLPASGLFGYEQDTVYVMEGPEGVFTLVLYIILSLMLLYFCLRCNRLMKAYPKDACVHSEHVVAEAHDASDADDTRL